MGLEEPKKQQHTKSKHPPTLVHSLRSSSLLPASPPLYAFAAGGDFLDGAGLESRDEAKL